MAAYSQSPRVVGPESSSPRAYDLNPLTPSHSPPHSLRSSLSLRTPVHNLSLHEYRKQQSAPIPRIEAPPGKTLRRKAAAFALNELERIPQATRATRPGSRSSLRSLQPSRSAQPFLPQDHSGEPQLAADQSFRSLSAEPRFQSSSTTSAVAPNASSKFRNFSARKRLPRPAATGARPLLPAIDTNVPTLDQPPQLFRPAPPSRTSLSTGEPRWSDGQSATTPSSFSLSRFPRPPQLADPSFSPPPDEKDSSCANAFSYTTTAPVTPPATPAIIHYRGASFDLINPHSSLQYHDIVTPSRDLDSTEYLPLQTSEEHLAIFEEMAPKRPLYGDFNAAHAGIMRRAEDSFGSSNINLPLIPTPAALSPDSSDYTSPFYSPESKVSNLEPSPLHVRKPANESRFSIKSLTRHLTRRLTKNSDPEDGEELRELYEPILRTTSAEAQDPYAQSLDSVYVSAPPASYFPGNAVSPVSPASSEFPHDPALLPHHESHDQTISCQPQAGSAHDHTPEELTSLIPDDPSIEAGRAEGRGVSAAEEEQSSRPYYDDLESIYASSSIYTTDDPRRSRYEPSLAGNRQSTAFFRFSGMDASGHAQEYSHDTLRGASHRISRPATQELYRRSVAHGAGKTDTISKFIDQYDANSTMDNSSSLGEERSTQLSDAVRSGLDNVKEELSVDDAHDTPLAPSRDHSGSVILQDDRSIEYEEPTARIQPVLARRFPSVRGPGLPPSAPAPLAPAFEYDEIDYMHGCPAPSELFSGDSGYSYSDTRNLLRIPPSDGAELPALRQDVLQPSSSYSQPEVKALDPSSSYSQDDGEAPSHLQYAIDRHGQPIDGSAIEKAQKDRDIPAMWTGRGSVSLSRNKRRSHRSSAARTVGDEKADWETIDGDSHKARESLDSIADYSSSEEGEPLNPAHSFPQWDNTKHARFLNYIHPSPLRKHANPFGSSPPHLETRASVRTAPEIFSPTMMSSPPASTTTPIFGYRSHPIDFLGNGVNEPRDTPWESPYTLSSKETQELLASGPNDDILLDSEPERKSHWLSSRLKPRGTKESRIPDEKSDGNPHWLKSPSKSREKGPISSSLDSMSYDMSVERDSALLKLPSLNPKSGISAVKGKPKYAQGSSGTENVSPDTGISYRQGCRHDPTEYNDFYAAPFPATGSVTRIELQKVAPQAEFERSPSEMTLFPGANGLEPVQPSSPLAGPSSRLSLGNSTRFRRAPQPSRTVSRTAVPGQTKLREMVLASSGPRSSSSTSSNVTRFSQLMRLAEQGRPSTSHTTTPLRSGNLSMNSIPGSDPIVAYTHSPHLLVPRREVRDEDEERRRKLSWLIFAVFCVFPPFMFLYRMWGDTIIVTITKGQLGSCTVKSKRTALIAGIVINMGLVIGLMVPVLTTQALKAV